MLNIMHGVKINLFDRVTLLVVSGAAEARVN